VQDGETSLPGIWRSSTEMTPWQGRHVVGVECENHSSHEAPGPGRAQMQPSATLIRKPAWLRDVQRPPESLPRDAPPPMPVLFDAEHRPIASLERWSRRKTELERAWLAFLGKIPAFPAKSTWNVVQEDRPEGVIRQLVSYDSEPGLTVEAYLLRPDRPARGRPGAVVLHSTANWTIRQPAGLEGPAALHIGLHLARRGYVAFCPRCFLWQYARPEKLASAVDWLHTRHPAVTGMAKMLFDARRAVDMIVAQPDVDPRRIGAIGHSLGAKEVLYLAAFDERVRAAVSSEGGIGLTFSNWDAPWYLSDAIRRRSFGLDHAQVLSLSAPRAFLLIGGQSADGDGSWPYIAEVLPLWKLCGAPDAVGLYNHRQGHAFPPEAQERAYEWLDWFLRA
jgi:Dienelactone hydrolase family